MLNTYLVVVEETEILRNEKNWPGKVVVLDANGLVVAHFPEFWTNDQIFDAIEFANRAYGYGYGRGQNDKMKEIKNTLGLSSV